MWGGNPSLIWNAPVDEVINMHNFNNFIADYQAEDIAIANEDRK